MDVILYALIVLESQQLPTPLKLDCQYNLSVIQHHHPFKPLKNATLVSTNITMIKSVFTRFTLGMAGWLPSLEASKNN